MAFDFSVPTSFASLASLFEVGVGTNLGLILIDGSKKYLTLFGKKVADGAEDVVEEFLPVLEANSKASQHAVKLIQNWSAFATAGKNVIAADWLFFFFKSLCILVALFFVVSLGLSPFVSQPINFSQVVLLMGLAIFPIFIAAVHLVSASIFAQSTELKPRACMTARDEALNVQGFWVWNGLGCAASSSERA